MESKPAAPASIDEYILGFPPQVQDILTQIRKVVREAAPNAQEVVSYKMPALKQHGMLVYFAAFKNHIGFYPPISGDAGLLKAIAPYAGAKGNLRFPFDKPIPFAINSLVCIALLAVLEIIASKLTCFCNNNLLISNASFIPKSLNVLSLSVSVTEGQFAFACRIKIIVFITAQKYVLENN